MATKAHTVPQFLLEGFCSAGMSRDPERPALWVGYIRTGKIRRRGPENVGISRGLYDGPGALADATQTLEEHLKKIESNAAIAIRRLATAMIGSQVPIPEIFRFISWQAARTPGWMETEQKWLDELGWPSASDTIEQPPAFMDDIRERSRPLTLENPATGERREVSGAEDFQVHVKQGWKWILGPADKLEMLHLQAWYFQQRHFPRLTWLQLRPPNDEDFVIGDRGVSWLVDGYADMPPAALRDPAAEVIAPLTRKIALVGRHAGSTFALSPREVNQRIAFAASNWVAGPTKEVVEQALRDRDSHLPARNLRVVRS